MHKIISLSGGKDSTALALFAIDTKKPEDQLTFVFCDTGNEHLLTYQYLDYLDGYLRSLGFAGVTRLKADFSQKLLAKRENLLKTADSTDWNTARFNAALDNLKPSLNPFLDLCMLKGRFPSPLARFCTQELKLEPLKAFIRGILGGGRTAKTLSA